MDYLNQISQVTADLWLQNFENASGNIFEPFQSNTFLSKKVYDELNNNNMYNIRIYMGLDANSNPKVIAMSSYFLHKGDNHMDGYTDMIIEGKIYDLGRNSIITIDQAKEYINNWKVNLNENLFKFGFLIPRPNVVKFFEEDYELSVRLFFGIDENNEIKMMMQKSNPGTGDVILNYAHPCPSLCSLDTRMID